MIPKLGLLAASKIPCANPRFLRQKILENLVEIFENGRWMLKISLGHLFLARKHEMAGPFPHKLFFVFGNFYFWPPPPPLLEMAERSSVLHMNPVDRWQLLPCMGTGLFGVVIKTRANPS